MRKYVDSCNSRRAASDLLSWSLGGKPHYGHDYDRPGYEAPKDPANPPRSVGEIVAEMRALGENVLRAVLLWWLSFDEKEGKKR